LNITFRTLD